MVGFVETKDNLEKYATVSYKHNSVDTGKAMEDTKDPEYTDPEETAYPTDRAAYKKWEH